jgi:hypothetical protein
MHIHDIGNTDIDLLLAEIDKDYPDDNARRFLNDIASAPDVLPAEDNTDAPLVVTGQGDFARHYTPELRSAGRRRGSMLAFAALTIAAATYPWWSKGF